MRTLSAPLGAALCLLGLALAAPSVRADAKADDLLREVERATKSVDSLGADLQVTLTTQNLAGRPQDPRQPRQNDSGFGQGNEPVSFTYTGTVKLKRANLERIELADPVHQTIACDGAYLWTLLPTNEYIKSPADPRGKFPTAYTPILLFFAPETARTAGVIPPDGADVSDNFVLRYLGKERVAIRPVRSTPESGGTTTGREAAPQEFDVIEVRQLRPTPQSVKLYINSDKMVTRVVSETRKGNVSTIQDVSLLHVKLGQKFDASQFAFSLPANARPFALRPAPSRP